MLPHLVGLLAVQKAPYRFHFLDLPEKVTASIGLIMTAQLAVVVLVNKILGALKV
jgi:hypothetical protein